MSSRDHTEEKLERLVSQVLRDQPLRQAPASLEVRVLTELAARARLPWWRRGVASWPAFVRVPVIAGCAVCVPLVWVMSLWLATRLVTVTRSRIAGPLATLRGTGHTLASLGAATTHIIQSIPREWLLGGIIASATVYAVLFALIAFGYSLLCPRPEYSKAH
ncbi:MAG TPA: hypothetical protein VMU52_02585 [Steroidobacteraceae bacterium]|nr:hypothetical protein [Steroidobacteraceae bacterium]